MPPGLSTIIHLPLTISFHSCYPSEANFSDNRSYLKNSTWNLSLIFHLSQKFHKRYKSTLLSFTYLYRTLVTKHDLLHKMGLIGTGRLLPSQYRISGRTCFGYESVSVLLRPIWHFMSLKVLLSFVNLKSVYMFAMHLLVICYIVFLHNINNRHCHWWWNFLKYFFLLLKFLAKKLSLVYLFKVR